MDRRVEVHFKGSKRAGVLSRVRRKWEEEQEEPEGEEERA